MKKTRAIEILEKAGINFDTGSFEAKDFTAEEVARELHLPINSVCKTLVVRLSRGDVVMALVPGDKELSLKKLAQAAGDKRAEMVRIDELQRLTGYIKGGVSPFGGKKRYPIFMHKDAGEHGRLSISAGLRGLQILISPVDFVRAAEATEADLTE